MDDDDGGQDFTADVVPELLVKLDNLFLMELMQQMLMLVIT